MDLCFAKLFKAKELAKSSKQLMWREDSVSDHLPPVDNGTHRAPQPIRLASDSIIKSGLDVKIAFPFQS